MEILDRPTAQPAATGHRLQMTDCRLLELSGIQEVSAYDAYSATLETACGTLVIGGSDIRVRAFSAEDGQARIEGEIEYLQYQHKKSERAQGLLQRLFR